MLRPLLVDAAQRPLTWAGAGGAAQNVDGRHAAGARPEEEGCPALGHAQVEVLIWWKHVAEARVQMSGRVRALRYCGWTGIHAGRVAAPCHLWSRYGRAMGLESAELEIQICP